MGSRAFKGFLLSICSPALSATLISVCLGTSGGRLCWTCVREGPLDTSCLARGCCTAKWWLLEPSWGIVLLRRLQLCRGDHTNVTCMPWHWGSPSLPTRPGSSLDKPLELCLQYPRLAWWRIAPVCETMLSPLPSSSLPPSCFSSLSF